MQRSIILLTVFISLQQQLHAQNYFKKAIDDSSLTGENIYLEAIEPAAFNRYVVAGYIETTAAEKKALVMAVDDEANIIWQKQFESDTGFTLSTVCMLDDKIYLGGRMNSNGVVIICDTMGNLLQSMKVTSTSDQHNSVNAMVAINGKMYLNCFHAPDGFHLMRIDGNGIASSFGKYIYDEGFTVEGMVTGDSHLYVYGYMSTSYGEVYGMVAKMDTNGFVNWTKRLRLDNNYELYINKAVMNADNTLQLFCTLPDNFTGGPNRFLQLKMGADGSEIGHKAWEKSSDYDVLDLSVAAADESGYTVCTYSSYYQADTIVLQHFDQNMTADWTVGYDLQDEDHTKAIASLPGNATFITQIQESTGNGVLHKVGASGESCNFSTNAFLDIESDLFIYSQDVYQYVTANFIMGSFSVDVSESLTVTEYCPGEPNGLETEKIGTGLALYPNPAAGISNLKLQLSKEEHVRIELHSMQKGLIKTLLDKKLPGGNHVLPLDFADQPSGIYLITVQTGSSLDYLKLVME